MKVAIINDISDKKKMLTPSLLNGPYTKCYHLFLFFKRNSKKARENYKDIDVPCVITTAISAPGSF